MNAKKRYSFYPRKYTTKTMPRYFTIYFIVSFANFVPDPPVKIVRYKCSPSIFASKIISVVLRLFQAIQVSS